MSIEDTFGYRFVRTSLVLLNCIVVIRLLSLLLQFSHVIEPTFVLFILLIGSNFMVAVIGAVREHRVSVILTGSITLIIFLSLIFTAKENKGVNLFLLILLAISVQSLIFSEMLKERQTFFAQRRDLNNYIHTLSGNNRNVSTNGTTPNGHLAAVVVYQTPGLNSPSGALFMVDSELGKDLPPPYYAPPPKYEDAIKLNPTELTNTTPTTSSFPSSSSSTSNIQQVPTTNSEESLHNSQTLPETSQNASVIQHCSTSSS